MSYLESEKYKTLCCIRDCDKPTLAAGLCNMHWRRNKKYGSPVLLAMPAAANKGRPLIERFTDRIKKVESGCWVWTAGKDQDGYGLFRGLVGGTLYKRAHRWSIAHHKGEHPAEGQNVCHTCDVPSCVNPEHLFLGSVGDNQRDKWAKKRGFVHRGSDHWSTRLTEDDVRAIRASSERQKDLAALYGVTQTTISDIRRRKSWSHIE